MATTVFGVVENIPKEYCSPDTAPSATTGILVERCGTAAILGAVDDIHSNTCADKALGAGRGIATEQCYLGTDLDSGPALLQTGNVKSAAGTALHIGDTLVPSTPAPVSKEKASTVDRPLTSRRQSDRVSTASDNRQNLSLKLPDKPIIGPRQASLKYSRRYQQGRESLLAEHENAVPTREDFIVELQNALTPAFSTSASSDASNASIKSIPRSGIHPTSIFSENLSRLKNQHGWTKYLDTRSAGSVSGKSVGSVAKLEKDYVRRFDRHLEKSSQTFNSLIHEFDSLLQNMRHSRAGSGPDPAQGITFVLPDIKIDTPRHCVGCREATPYPFPEQVPDAVKEVEPSRSVSNPYFDMNLNDRSLENFSDASVQKTPSLLYNEHLRAPRHPGIRSDDTVPKNPKSLRRYVKQNGLPLQPRTSSRTSGCETPHVALQLEPIESKSQAQTGKSTVPALDHGLSLRGRRHLSLRLKQGLGIEEPSHRRQPVARCWSTPRKRFSAAVACIGTALVGLIVGIYAGEVPAIQYHIVDLSHNTILGNVVFYIGLALPTVFLWPLPLLHGRKPYTLAALTAVLTLQFPQGLVVAPVTSPDLRRYRVVLLLSRGISGVALGFASMNFKGVLLDLFGASLQSGNPHQEYVDPNDVRRHGGGLGVWLAIWCWCYIGSISLGFAIGASIINTANPAWGFWLCIIVSAVVLILTIIAPEVRRSAYRRSLREVLSGSGISRRLARGEIMMHVYATGPRWWWQEVYAGMVLSLRMLNQLGFATMAIYMAWVYGQNVLLVVLLGALSSRDYQFRSTSVGLCVFGMALGAMVAIPFEKASLFSISRHHPPRSDVETFEKRITWTSHLLRRTLSMFLLPLVVMAFAASCNGPPTPYILPAIFAAIASFLSVLVVSECHGLIMETFDTSDLHSLGSSEKSHARRAARSRTNFSAFPRIAAGNAIIHALGFILAACGTQWGGVIERHVGAQTAAGIVSAVLFTLSIAVFLVLWRWKLVEISTIQRPGGIVGGTVRARRMNILELGAMSRWMEIKRLV